MVNFCMVVLYVSMVVVGIEVGVEVIIMLFIFCVMVNVIEYVGFMLVLVDVDLVI